MNDKEVSAFAASFARPTDTRRRRKRVPVGAVGRLALGRRHELGCQWFKLSATRLAPRQATRASGLRAPTSRPAEQGGGR